jgi:hypothetical protein
VIGAVALIAVTAFAAGPGFGEFDGASVQPIDQEYAALPAAPAPAFRIPAPKPLDRSAVSSWSTVVREVTVHSAPSPESAAVTRLSTTTPEGTSNVVLVVGRAEDVSGQVWAQVRLPILPNNSVGWVPRSALSGYHLVRTRLVVDRARLEATLWLGARVVFRAPVGVGRPAWPTPAGRFYVRDRIRSLASPFYGPIAFGTSARSSVLTDWPAGGFIGIHGTSEPELIPGRISHGCIRMRNEDIRRLARLLPVGTPLTIV